MIQSLHQSYPILPYHFFLLSYVSFLGRILVSLTESRIRWEVDKTTCKGEKQTLQLLSVLLLCQARFESLSRHLQ